MLVLIGNIVKTDTADYRCGSREEAEALYMSLRTERHHRRDEFVRKPVTEARARNDRPLRHGS